MNATQTDSSSLSPFLYPSPLPSLLFPPFPSLSSLPLSFLPSLPFCLPSLLFPSFPFHIAMEPVVQDKAPHPNRPSSLKHHPPHQQQEQEFLRPHPPHQQQEREIPRHRPRSGSGSQEMRFAAVHRRSSVGSTGGGRRGRLNSDSSLRSSGLKMKTPSATSIEKIDIPESPPSSPPPPYSEVDRSNRRFAQFSLSQQPEVPSGLYSAPMHRSSSQGHTSSNSTYQMRPRINTHPAMPSSERRRGTPQDVLHHPPAAGEGGTLV